MAYNLPPELAAAIENAYAVFARYPCPAHIEVCEQCYPKLPALFAKTPLREVKAGLLIWYVDSTGCGIDETMVNDVRYLLPRMLELIAAGEDVGVHGESDGLRILQPMRWREAWPADEVQALDRFFAALFRHQMQQPLAYFRNRYGMIPGLREPDIASFLHLVGCAGGDAARRPLPIAEQLLCREMDVRIAGLARTLAWDAINEWTQSRDYAPVFDADLAIVATDEELGASCSEERVAAWEWLVQPALHARVEAACLREQDADAAEILSVGEQIIAALIRSRARGA